MRLTSKKKGLDKCCDHPTKDKSYLEVIDDLLMTVQSIVTGIASVSSNVINNSLECKIHFSAKRLTVILLYELCVNQVSAPIKASRPRKEKVKRCNNKAAPQQTTPRKRNNQVVRTAGSGQVGNQKAYGVGADIKPRIGGESASGGGGGVGSACGHDDSWYCNVPHYGALPSDGEQQHLQHQLQQQHQGTLPENEEGRKQEYWDQLNFSGYYEDGESADMSYAGQRDVKPSLHDIMNSFSNEWEEIDITSVLTSNSFCGNGWSDEGEGKKTFSNDNNNVLPEGGQEQEGRLQQQQQQQSNAVFADNKEICDISNSCSNSARNIGNFLDTCETLEFNSRFTNLLLNKGSEVDRFVGDNGMGGSMVGELLVGDASSHFARTELLNANCSMEHGGYPLQTEAHSTMDGSGQQLQQQQQQQQSGEGEGSTKGGKQHKKKPLSCSYCERTFVYNCLRVIHERVHTGERPYSCSYCGKSFRSSSHKERHEIIHTGEKPFACRYCGKSFNSVSNKKKHELIHAEEKPFPCTYCHKTFPQLHQKLCHETVHTGEKPYSCRVCEKRFGHKSNKDRHEKIHERHEKRHECDFCGKKFSRLETKSEHERTHTGDRPYTCRHCQKTFAQPLAKAVHERLHAGEKPYACRHCKKTFTQKTNRDVHIKKMHADKR